MKKVVTNTLLSATFFAAISTQSNAKELNSIIPERLESSTETEISNKIDVENYLQNNATSMLNNNNKTKTESINKNAFKQYKVINSNTDSTGVSHYELKPKINNVLADDSTIKVHVNRDGKVSLINGHIHRQHIDVKNKVNISSSQAEKLAFKAIGKKSNDVANIDGFKIVSKNKLDINSEKERFIHNIELNYVSPKLAHWQIQVDASTGEILKKQNVIEHASEEGSGIGVNGDKKSPLNVSSNGGQYTLNDTTTDAHINTKSADETIDRFSPITHDSKHFDEKQQRPGVDAHYYAKAVYDYYLNTHGRNSYDGNAADINSVVHFDKNYNNAAWTGQYMVYGDGDGQTFNPLSGAKDIVAHELTHAVTERTANLEYANQSGALNESFSDVFGYFIDPDNWLMGEDVYTPKQDGDALRSLKNPEKYDQPAHMDQFYTGSEDNGGVHINSGIPNKAAYLTIQSIGKDKAEQIYYLALTQYLTSNAEFSDAKIALKQASDELYGHDSTESKSIDQAWTNVGVD
ncbi:M4 family metallopeptidase [Staphylococcus cohnii]|uniref:M4 family metallopeptidase n=1 Tax=Staphylococcus cohnii TaxID=29382 RepID=UPI00374F55B4